MNLLGTGVFPTDRRDEVRKDVRRAIRCEVAIDLTRGDLQTGGEAARAVAYVLVLDRAGPQALVQNVEGPPGCPLGSSFEGLRPRRAQVRACEELARRPVPASARRRRVT